MAILDLLPLLPYAYESMFSANEFSAFQGQIIDIKQSPIHLCVVKHFFSILAAILDLLSIMVFQKYLISL